MEAPPRIRPKSIDDYLEQLSKSVFQAGMSWRVVDAKWSEREGGFREHLRSFDEYEELATDLKKRFKFVGDSGTYHFLWTVSHPIPDWHTWAKDHGMTWGDKAAPKRAAPKKKAAKVTRPRR